MDYLETPTGNRISRRATITGSKHVVIAGNTTVCDGVVIDGTTAALKPAVLVGKYLFLAAGSEIRPPEGGCVLGSYNIIGERAVVELALTGSRVWIEPGCKIGAGAVIYECCVIRRGTVVAPKQIIPPYSEVSGQPGPTWRVRELNPSWRRIIEAEARKAQLLGMEEEG